MKNCLTLNELIQQDVQSKTLYNQLPKDVQVAMQEQRQNIHTYEELAKAVSAFEKRSHK